MSKSELWCLRTREKGEGDDNVKTNVRDEKEKKKIRKRRERKREKNNMENMYK